VLFKGIGVSCRRLLPFFPHLCMISHPFLSFAFRWPVSHGSPLLFSDPVSRIMFSSRFFFFVFFTCDAVFPFRGKRQRGLRQASFFLYPLCFSDFLTKVGFLTFGDLTTYFLTHEDLFPPFDSQISLSPLMFLCFFARALFFPSFWRLQTLYDAPGHSFFSLWFLGFPR